MIKTPDPEPPADQAARQNAKAAAIGDAVAEAQASATEAFGNAEPASRGNIAVGVLGLAIQLLENQPITAMETWLAYQAEGEQFIEDGQFASAAWSTRTAHVAMSQIAEQGRIVATEAWPFIEWLPAYFYKTVPGGTEAALRDWFGDAILLMPAWLGEMQS